MPPIKESTPEYTSFSEERRQVLGFLLTYLERRNVLTSEYYKKLVSLNGLFAEDINILVQSIAKAKHIAKKSHKSLLRSPSMPSASASLESSPSFTEGPSFYELLGKTLMDFITSHDKSIAQSATLSEGKLKDLFQGLAIDQQPELEAIDATIASLSNQQNTMSAKLAKLKGEYILSSQMVETSFEELKKRALIPFPNSTTSFSLTKASNYEKAFLDYSKKVESARKPAREFYEEVSRIRDAFEEIESKKLLLKKVYHSIQLTFRKSVASK
ncbi:hypothetical protein DI09_184p40 [Mitosporidium daphniae]|uniref:Uncharacterized protein n=1 Tax=Mitosporidium daphniae TaxID=1485682 RepID=A0A098VTS6_9MICR|nr:uncharacterized protein DI09_184p40 [Mitosporidium daphniae]KGG52352.1 hypothetical protein DI09_184p40 [Mitosporidium daphniae]|eukprot:XP_013238788.1 uncharacterized protein DI09_184p40 [Mitosporidium daphniae]